MLEGSVSGHFTTQFLVLSLVHEDFNVEFGFNCRTCFAEAQPVESRPTCGCWCEHRFSSPKRRSLSFEGLESTFQFGPVT